MSRFPGSFYVAYKINLTWVSHKSRLKYINIRAAINIDKLSNTIIGIGNISYCTINQQSRLAEVMGFNIINFTWE